MTEEQAAKLIELLEAQNKLLEQSDWKLWEIMTMMKEAMAHFIKPKTVIYKEEN